MHHTSVFTATLSQVSLHISCQLWLIARIKPTNHHQCLSKHVFHWHPGICTYFFIHLSADFFELTTRILRRVFLSGATPPPSCLCLLLGSTLSGKHWRGILPLIISWVPHARLRTWQSDKLRRVPPQVSAESDADPSRLCLSTAGGETEGEAKFTQQPADSSATQRHVLVYILEPTMKQIAFWKGTALFW